MKESLQITLRKNRRSEDLIQVARKSKGQNILHSYNQSADAIPEENPFSEAECFEIEWFDEMVKFFLERMNSDATELERYRLFLPEKLYQAMFKLSQACREHGVDYRPVDSMLKSIINKIRTTEKKLYEKTSIELDVLSDINYQEKSDVSEQLKGHAMKIFKVLIEQPDFYNRFNELAQTVYHKSLNIKPGHLKGYAQGHTMPSKWIFACAIDVISTNTSPVSIIDENALFDLWVKPGIRAGKSTNEISEKLKTWQCSEHIIEQAMHQANIAV
ncbi:hypothetical protein [Legionella israelensis]|uniref:Uncharacterized protein n=1 Tax=Legionella israelensis TaxID=454 RepID=A0A0W0V7N6_9GAMM|nr:hypothetical protein [Legionella israelensis]KTD15885.1 hypothetical protein Lisr_2272 [Legionella israelensis]QBS10718.1 hypothetical protein E4T55_13240 [Legionella israelensis]SCY41519.1 hypothetical protein SAMN02746069_02362 [Legionella israelensis DSM 19235]STX57681.1 Uncharacterised protein [Legionella israelensis]